MLARSGKPLQTGQSPNGIDRRPIGHPQLRESSPPHTGRPVDRIALSLAPQLSPIGPKPDMCGRYALAAEADEIPLQFWQQYQPDHHPSAQHDQPSTLDGQADSFGPVSEEAQLADRSIDGFRSVAGLPRESVGGLVSADLREAGLGRSGGGEAGELERVKRAPAIEWASEAAKARYRKRYNVSRVQLIT